MRLVPMIAAAIVLAALFMIVFQRETLNVYLEQVFPTVEFVSVVDEPLEPLPDGVGVVAIHSTAQIIDSAVVLRGRTQAARQVTVASETSGLVVSEPLRKGAYVNTGDTMCTLDPGTREASLAEARARLAEARNRIPEAQAAVAEASARAREAEINVNAARQLSRGGFASETRLVSAEAVSEAAAAGIQRASTGVASAEAGIEAATAMVAAAEREIERLVIQAPFAGLLETDTAELGTLMQPGSACATIIQLDPIKLLGFVPEADVNKVTVGAMAQARLTTGESIAGRVTFLSRSADNTTRTFQVEVEVPNSDLSIRDGQTVEIAVASAGRTAHLVPGSALTLNDDGVLGLRTVAPDSTALFIPVTLLRDTADGVWLTDLSDTVDIITVGQEFVIDGVTVAATFAEAKQ